MNLTDFVSRANTAAIKDTLQDACAFVAVLAFVLVVAAYVG